MKSVKCITCKTTYNTYDNTTIQCSAASQKWVIEELPLLKINIVVCNTYIYIKFKNGPKNYLSFFS